MTPIVFRAYALRIDGRDFAGRDVVFRANNPGAKKKWAALSFPIRTNHRLPDRPQRVEVFAESANRNEHYVFRLETPRLQRPELLAEPSGAIKPYITYKGWRDSKPVVLIVSESVGSTAGTMP